MPLLGPADQDRLRAEFSLMARRVHLLFFTQALGCETCLLTRQILDEFPALSDRIVIDEVNFVLDPDRARQYGVDRVPAIAVLYEDEPSTRQPLPEAGPPVLEDSRIRFLGMPAGYEFVSLVQAILLAGGRGSELSAASLERLALVDRPVVMQVFTTPT